MGANLTFLQKISSAKMEHQHLYLSSAYAESEQLGGENTDETIPISSSIIEKLKWG